MLKADGHFAPLPIISSRAVELGGTVATVGFPDPGLQGFASKVFAAKERKEHKSNFFAVFVFYCG